MQQASGAVIVISSHVIRGSVGNRAAVFALETLGHSVWSFPTIVLPWHPGHGPSTRIPQAGFEQAIDDLIDAPWLTEVRAVLTGYFGDSRQPEAVARLIRALKERNPDLFYLCDPVIGDVGGLYVPQSTAEAIKSNLLPLADIITPNRYELAWLAGKTLETNEQMAAAASALGPRQALVTSAVPLIVNSIANLYVSERRMLLAEHRLIANPPNGVGDLLSAVFLSRLLSGMDEEEALRLSSSSILEIVASTSAEGADELRLPAHAQSLMSPLSTVTMRRIVRAAAQRAV